MKTYHNVTCILPDDINTNENVCHMHASQILHLNGLRIESFPSSDEGLAYLVEVNGKMHLSRRRFKLVALAG